MKIGVSELLIILVIVVLLFGPTQIPKLMKMIGKGTKSFKEGLNSEDSDEEKKTEEKSTKDKTDKE